MSKLEIRKLYQKKRNSLTKDEVELRSQLVADNFIKNFLPKINFKNKIVACYISANNEVNPFKITSFCQSKYSNILCLPRIIENSSNLSFRKYENGDILEENILYSKIFEPKYSAEEIEPEIVFVPLVAFDRNNNRIGMGGGFYDSLIRRYKMNDKNTIFIGLAYDFQLCNSFEINNLDEKLDFIISESLIQNL